MDEQIPRM